MKNLETLHSSKQGHRVLLGLILSTTGCALSHRGFPRDSALETTIPDASNENSSDTTTVETGMEIASDTADSLSLSDTTESSADAGNDVVNDTIVDSFDGSDVVLTDTSDVVLSTMARCGRGLIPGYPLSYNIPTGRSVPAEIAIADSMPVPGVMVGISWGDSPTLEYVTFNTAAPSRALGNHVYTSPGTFTATWFVNETECGMQTFTVVDGSTTRPSCSSFVFDGLDNIRVGESTALRLNAFPRSAAPGDSPLTFNFGNLPSVPNILSTTGIATASVTAQNPPGPGSYSLQGWVVTPRGERADCPRPILTVRP